MLYNISHVLQKLQGGDLRSIGRSNEVVLDVLEDPALFAEVFEGLFSDDPRVRMRSADVLEKLSAQRPELLQPFKERLINQVSQIPQQEVQWHSYGYEAGRVFKQDLTKAPLTRMMSLQGWAGCQTFEENFYVLPGEGDIMTTFYRGAGVGTYWHTNDARMRGLVPRYPAMTPNSSSLMQHIARATTASPYISLTRSSGVAWSYAVFAGYSLSTRANPGYVYQIELSDPLPLGLGLIDPIVEIAARELPSPLASISYQHDGLPSFLLGVVDPTRMKRFLGIQIRQPPGSGGTPRTPILTIQLETLARTLRDAEVLVAGNIPSAFVVHRHDAYP